MTTTERGPLIGDWRSSAYGANRKAHLFVYDFSHKKHAACGARIALDKTGRVEHRKVSELCGDCLTEAGRHRG